MLVAGLFGIAAFAGAGSRIKDVERSETIVRELASKQSFLKDRDQKSNPLTYFPIAVIHTEPHLPIQFGEITPVNFEALHSYRLPLTQAARSPPLA